MEYSGYYKGELVADTTRENVGFNLVPNAAKPSTLLCDSLNLELGFFTETRFQIDSQLLEGKLISGDGEMLIESISFQFKSNADSTNRQYTVLAFRQN